MSVLIHDKHFVAIANSRQIKYAKSNLAYMTHRDFNKDGSESVASMDRKDSAIKWAKQSWYNHKEKKYEDKDFSEIEIDNIPVKGFSIVGSTSRWSSDNKLVYIEDPRGFVVEVSVSNLTTLIKYVSINQGVIENPCIWGKSGNIHILLPTNTDFYNTAMESTSNKNNMVAIKSLDIGDKVTSNFDSDEDLLTYLGKAKIAWNSTTKTSVKTHRYQVWQRLDSDPITESSDKIDDRYYFIFANKDGVLEFKATGKVRVISSGNSVQLKDLHGGYLPERIAQNGNYSYYDHNLKDYTICTVKPENFVWKGGENCLI